MGGKHAINAAGVGTVIKRVKGKAFAALPDQPYGSGKVFDENDLRFPTIEPTGFFVVTRRITMKAQKIGECVDGDSPRKCGEKHPSCPKGMKCLCPKSKKCEGEKGYCRLEKTWCPSLGDHN